MTMKLYGSRLSPYVERVYQQVQMKSIADEVDFAGLPKDGIKSPEYLALNPFGKMPVLIDGDKAIPESTIICEYIENKFPATPMMPTKKDDHLAVNMVMRMLDIYIFQNLFELASARGSDMDPEAMAAKLGTVASGIDVIEQYVTGGDNLIGDDRTLADCAFLPAAFFFDRLLVPAGIDAYIDRPNISAWRDANKGGDWWDECFEVMDKELALFMQRLAEERAAAQAEGPPVN